LYFIAQEIRWDNIHAREWKTNEDKTQLYQCWLGYSLTLII